MRVLDDVNDLIGLDDDIETFTLDDLKTEEIDEAVNARVVEKVIELGSSNLQCFAIDSANNPKKRKRCSQAHRKGSNLCHRHWCSLENYPGVN